jgi:serine/threonine protein kinase
MSPEQCSQDSEIDARSDIYSFGVILYEMLVGHVPFSGESPTMVMMKHLQEPVPSILDERSDVPAAVGRVVARAMAKLPDNRYQSVNELLEDLTIAAGMTVLRLDSAVPPAVVADEPDEITVVRPRVEPVGTLRRAPVTVPVGAPPPPSKSSVSPVKILIPSAAALLVVFAAFYVFTRNPAMPTNTNLNQQPSLVADPNSQPVQPAQPPTGKGEEGISAGGVINSSANANVNPNANAAISPIPVEELSPAANTNTNTNSNSNQKVPALPEPTKSVTPVTAPAPPPGGTKTPEVKPSPSPAASPNDAGLS